MGFDLPSGARLPKWRIPVVLSFTFERNRTDWFLCAFGRQRVWSKTRNPSTSEFLIDVGHLHTHRGSVVRGCLLLDVSPYDQLHGAHCFIPDVWGKNKAKNEKGSERQIVLVCRWASWSLPNLSLKITVVSKPNNNDNDGNDVDNDNNCKFSLFLWMRRKLNDSLKSEKKRFTHDLPISKLII